MEHPNPFLALTSPIYELLKPFCADDCGMSLPSDYGAECKKAIDDFENLALNQKLSTKEVECVKYALVALADEVISVSAWQYRYEWMGNPLQMQYFSEHLAGEEFFQKLSKLRQYGAQYLNVLEIYYTCLCLGFSGMYELNGREKLLALQTDLRNFLIKNKGVIDSKLSEPVKYDDKLTRKPNKKNSFLIIISITVALLLAVYFSYSLVIDHHVGKIIQEIY